MIDFKNWIDVWSRLGSDVTENAMEQHYWLLINSYREHHRYYHNDTHLKHVLTELANAKPDINTLTDQEFAEIEMALWFHDVIYDAQKLDNEEQSAKLFTTVAENMGLPTAIIRKISDLIILTADHRTAQTEQEKLLVDCDLSILGADTADFNKYDQDIRKEYSFVDDSIYQNARAEVLKKFLDQRHIFKTPYFQKKYEYAARQNMTQRIQKNAKIVPIRKKKF